MRGADIPYGYCQCGCGQRPNLYRTSARKKGIVKGTPRRYLRGHQNRPASAATMPHSAPDGDQGTRGRGNYVCAGTRPDGTPCERPVRNEHDYCLLHDPLRAMVRTASPKQRRKVTDAVRLAREVGNEREHDPVLVKEV
jgi:hypothetical protein